MRNVKNNIKVATAFLGIILIASCKNPIKVGGSDIQTNVPDFIKKYKETTLPIVMKGCEFEKGLPLTNENILYNRVDSNRTPDGSVPYCTFRTNGDYYAVINLGLADCILPSLVTYDKNGKLIDEKFIGIGYCGSGPGFHCEEFTSIRNDFSIYTSDTISEAETDSLGNEIKETFQKYVMFKKGRLLSSGKIELTDTLRQVLEK